MKKLALLAAFAGVLTTGAFAQASDVTFTVNFFAALTVDVEPSFTITDGGFNGPYDTTNGAYSVTANAAWDVTGVASAPTMPAGSFGTWTLAAINVPDINQAPGANQPGDFDARLNSTTPGHYIGPGSVTGTITLTVSAN